jgi:tetratricopeptide (TPR) repeat protein
LLPKIPSASDRADAEFSLQLDLGIASMPVLGYAAPEVGDALERAATLARQNRSGQQTFVVVGGLYAFHISRADHNRAHQLASEMLEIAARERSELLTVEGHFALGANLFWQGRFAESLQHLELGSVASADFSPLNIVGADTPAFALAYQGNCLWQLGFPDQAAEISRRGLQRVDSLDHPFSAATVRLATVQGLLNINPDLAQQEAERMIAISNEHGFPFQETIARIYRYMALLHRRPDREILLELAVLIRSLDKIGAKTALPIHLATLAKGYGDAGEPGLGSEFVDQALNLVEQTAEYQMEAELHRLKGQLSLLPGQPNSAEAEREFRSAIDISRGQQAKSWELRAATSLSRLLASQHRRDEARTILAEIYNWFTEGFDTADLKDAKALLDELTT